MTKGKIPNVAGDGACRLRLFRLQRDDDETGTSGTGMVAVGALYPSGFVVLEWTSAVRSMGFYHSIADVEAIHGHGGKTYVVWEAA